MKARASFAAASVLAAMTATPLLLPQAQATPDCSAVGSVGNDCVFLTMLKSQGIQVDDPDQAISVGKEVCESLRSGESQQSLVQALLQDNSDLTGKQAQFLVFFSLNTYCPANSRGGMSPGANG
jgi:hypothetical protein